MATTEASNTAGTAVSIQPAVGLPDFRWRDYFDPRANPANAMTVAGIIAALSVIMIGRDLGLWFTAACIWFSTLMDLFDGTVARTMDPKPYPVGHILDFVNDLFAGVGTMVVALQPLLKPLNVVGWIIALIWCSAAGGRLVRFTVKGHSNQFQGCPAPFATNVLLILMVVNAELVTVNPYIVAITAIAFSAAMVSSYVLPAWCTFGDTVSRRIVEWMLTLWASRLVNAPAVGKADRA